MISKRLALTTTIMSGFLWGTSFPVIKVGLQYVDSYTFAFLRLLIASIAALAIVVTTKKLQVSLFKDKLIWLLGISNALGFVLQYVGMNYTTSSKSALLVDSNFILVAVLSVFIFKEHFSRLVKSALLIGVVGLVLLETGGDMSRLMGGELLGDLLVFLAGASWAFFIVWTKTMVSKGVDLIAMTACVMSLTAVLLFPFMLMLGDADLTLIPVAGWGAVAFTGVLCSVTAYVLWSIGLKRMTATTSMIILLSEVVWALIFSFVFLGDSFTLVSGIGAICIIMSILFASR